MARLFSDENFSHDVVGELRRLGHDVLTIQQVGKANIGTPDSEVLDLATADLRAVLTENRKDFLRLHRQRPDHAGIIACTDDKDTVGKAGRIHDAIQGVNDLRGAFIRINRPPQ